MPRSPINKCAFCGRPRREDPSEAHAWSKRYSKSALRSQPPGTRFISKDIVNGAPLPQRIEHRINVKTPHGPVCGKCNSGWMNRLEQRAWPVLMRLNNASGEPPVTLSRTDQTLLASYALLFAMVYELATVPHDLLISGHQRHAFRRTHLPPRRRVAVWIGAYIGPSPSRAFRPPLISMSDSELWILPVNVTTFTFGQIAFQVLANRWMEDMSWGKPGIPTPAPAWAPAEVRIWPYLPRVREVSWPPDQRFDDAWLEEWAKRWERLPPGMEPVT